MRSPSETVNEMSRNRGVAPKALVKPCAFKIGGIVSVYRFCAIFLAWWNGVFQGFFEKTGCRTWLFCGQRVVQCVAKPDNGCTFLGERKFCKFFRFIFAGRLSPSRG